MAIWEIIPTCSDAMSCYTLCALTIVVSSAVLVFTVFFWWVSNENRRIENAVSDETHRVDKKFGEISAAISGHNAYIDDTAKVINDIHVELAVQRSSVKEIKADIAEMKSDIKADIAALQVDIKTLLMR